MESSWQSFCGNNILACVNIVQHVAYLITLLLDIYNVFILYISSCNVGDNVSNIGIILRLGATQDGVQVADSSFIVYSYG